jgi:myosin-3
MPYSEFVKRYAILAYPVKSSIPLTKESCIQILNKLGLKNWQAGKNKIFLKYYHAEQLSQLFEEMNKKIIIIQCTIRRFLARRSFFHEKNHLNKAATIIQKCNQVNT